MNNMKKSVAVTVGALLAGGMTLSATANPFSYSDLGPGYQQEEQKEREAKCGEEHKAKMKEKADEKAKEGKCGEGKCGEGKCGEEHKAKMKEKADEKAKEGKCGEGKCGEGKCGGQ